MNNAITWTDEDGYQWLVKIPKDSWKCEEILDHVKVRHENLTDWGRHTVDNDGMTHVSYWLAVAARDGKVIPCDYDAVLRGDTGPREGDMREVETTANHLEIFSSGRWIGTGIFRGLPRDDDGGKR